MLVDIVLNIAIVIAGIAATILLYNSWKKLQGAMKEMTKLFVIAIGLLILGTFIHLVFIHIFKAGVLYIKILDDLTIALAFVVFALAVHKGMQFGKTFGFANSAFQNRILKELEKKGYRLEKGATVSDLQKEGLVSNEGEIAPKEKLEKSRLVKKISEQDLLDRGLIKKKKEGR